MEKKLFKKFINLNIKTRHRRFFQGKHLKKKISTFFLTVFYFSVLHISKEHIQNKINSFGFVHEEKLIFISEDNKNDKDDFKSILKLNLP